MLVGVAPFILSHLSTISMNGQCRDSIVERRVGEFHCREVGLKAIFADIPNVRPVKLYS